MWAAFFSGRSTLALNALVGLGVSLALWGVAVGLATQSWTTGTEALRWSHAGAWWTVVSTLWAVTWTWTAWLCATRATEQGRGLGPAMAGMAANMVLALAFGLLTGDRLHILLTVWHGHAVDGMTDVAVRYIPAGSGETRGQLALTGDLGPGSAERLAQALAQHPQVRRVNLESTRGLVTEALAMAQQLRGREMDTVLVGHCNGPCAVVFMSGTARWMAPSGQLAFHQTHAPVLPFLRTQGPADERVLAFYLAQGVPPGLAKAMVSAPAHQAWVPELDERQDLEIRPTP
jgi:hypothetical protein